MGRAELRKAAKANGIRPSGLKGSEWRIRTEEVNNAVIADKVYKRAVAERLDEALSEARTEAYWDWTFTREAEAVELLHMSAILQLHRVFPRWKQDTLFKFIDGMNEFTDMYVNDFHRDLPQMRLYFATEIECAPAAVKLEGDNNEPLIIDVEATKTKFWRMLEEAREKGEEAQAEVLRQGVSGA